MNATDQCDLEARKPGAASRALPWACFCFMLVAWYAVVAPRAELSQWQIRAGGGTPNVGGELSLLHIQAAGSAPYREALAWQSGRMDLPHPGRDTLHDRLHDTAYVAETGKVYSVTPPLLTLVCLSAATLDRYVLGVDSEVIGPILFHTAVLAPLCVLAFWAFRSQISDPRWAAFLGFAFLAASTNYPLVVWSKGGNAGYVNHLLGQAGILLIFGDLLGKRRIWPAAIGLVVGAWSRQLTLLYALPILATAWFGVRRRRDMAIAAAAVAVAAGALMVLNQLKFGSPLDTGYARIYAGRTDELALRAEQGLFALRWVPENLSTMLWSLPDVDVDQQGLSIKGGVNGNSLPFSMPVVVLAFVAGGAWFRDRRRRWIMASTIPVVLGVLLYHAPGFISTGCYRFGMDYVPVWLIVAAPALVSARWRWWTLGCTAWSLVYFQVMDFRW